DFLGKLFSQGGLFSDLIRVEGENANYYFTYPPLLSLAHSINYILRQNNPMLLYSAFYIVLLIIFYSRLRIRVNELTSLLFTLFLAVVYLIFYHSTIAYSNLSFSVSFSLGIIYIAD